MDNGQKCQAFILEFGNDYLNLLFKNIPTECKPMLVPQYDSDGHWSVVCEVTISNDQICKFVSDAAVFDTSIPELDIFIQVATILKCSKDVAIKRLTRSGLICSNKKNAEDIIEEINEFVEDSPDFDSYYALSSVDAWRRYFY